MTHESVVKSYLNLKVEKLQYGATPHTVFIAVQKRDSDKKWVAAGTGFPLHSDGRIFIVTAAHNFRGMTDEPAELTGPNGSVRLFRDNNRVVISSILDLAVIAMNSDDLITLFGDCICLELDLNAVSGRVQSHAFQVYGYPTSKNKHSNTQGWTRSGWRVTLGPAVQIPSRSQLNQVGVPLLGFEIDLKKMVNEEGEADNRLGKLEGMSGGPVVSHALHETAVGPGKIAGMFLEWHAGERVAVVMPALAIATAIQCWYPTNYSTDNANYINS